MPGSDEAAITASVLTLLRSEPGVSGLCVDDGPRGEPLAIYRTMAMTHDRALQPWRRPRPLGYSPRIGGRTLFEDAIGRESLRLKVPDTVENALPRATQARLDTMARQLVIGGQSTGEQLAQPPGVSDLKVRWWARNRIDRGCKRTFVLSRLVHNDQAGFVTVTADHRGTTYAVERGPGGWQVTGQWGEWLY